MQRLSQTWDLGFNAWKRTCICWEMMDGWRLHWWNWSVVGLRWDVSAELQDNESFILGKWGEKWGCMCLKVFIFGMPIRLSYTFSFSCKTDEISQTLNPRRPMFGEKHRCDPLRAAPVRLNRRDEKLKGIAAGVNSKSWYCSWWGFCCSFHFGWKKLHRHTLKDNLVLFERRIILRCRGNSSGRIWKPFRSHSASKVSTDPSATKTTARRSCFVAVAFFFFFFGYFCPLNNFRLQNS